MMTVDTLITDYEHAYEECNGRPCTLTYRKGWFTMNGGKKVRKAQLVDMIRTLRMRANRQRTEEAVGPSRDCTYFKGKTRTQIVNMLAHREQDGTLADFLRENTKGYMNLGSPMVFTLADDLGLFDK